MEFRPLFNMLTIHILMKNVSLSIFLLSFIFFLIHLLAGKIILFYPFYIEILDWDGVRAPNRECRMGCFWESQFLLYYEVVTKYFGTL